MHFEFIFLNKIVLSYHQRINLPHLISNQYHKNSKKASISSFNHDSSVYRFKIIYSSLFGYSSVDELYEQTDPTSSAYIKSLLEEYDDLPKVDIIIHIISINGENTQCMFLTNEKKFKMFLENRNDINDPNILDSISAKEWAKLIIDEWNKHKNLDKSK